MYRIGICDDEIATCTELECLLERYFNESGLNGEIEAFYTGGVSAKIFV